MCIYIYIYGHVYFFVVGKAPWSPKVVPEIWKNVKNPEDNKNPEKR